MKTRIIVAAAFSFAAGQYAAANAADRTYSVEISPSGARYAVVRDLGEQRAIAIYDVDDPTAKPMALGIGAIDVEDFEWGGEDYVLYRVSGEKTVSTTNGLKTMKFARWLSVSRTTGKSETLFGNEFGSDYYYFIGGAGRLVSSLPTDGENALFARSYVKITEKGPTRLQNGNDVVEYSLQAANFKSGAARLKESGNSATFDWVVDANGALVARIDQQEATKTLKIFAADPKGRLALSGEIAGDRIEGGHIFFYGSSSSGVIQVATEMDGRIRLAGFDLSSGAISQIPLLPGDPEIAHISYDPRFARIRLAHLLNGQIAHIEESDQKLQTSLEKALPGAVVAIESRSLSGDRVVAHATYADRGDEYYLFDVRAKKLELVAANQAGRP